VKGLGWVRYNHLPISPDFAVPKEMGVVLPCLFHPEEIVKPGCEDEDEPTVKWDAKSEEKKGKAKERVCHWPMIISCGLRGSSNFFFILFSFFRLPSK
jgi:hypothetical protein